MRGWNLKGKEGDESHGNREKAMSAFKEDCGNTEQ